MTEIRYALLLGILTYAAWKDLKTKSIPYFLPVVGAMVALLCYMIEGISTKETLPAVGQALIPGCFLLMTAFFTDQKVGYGDGLMVLVLGALTDLIHSVLSLMFGLCVSCLLSMFFIACKRVGMKDQIPFLPFLLAGYILTLVVLS